MNFLFDSIANTRASDPNRIALHDDGGSRLTYEALDQIVKNIAQAIMSTGLPIGGTVAIESENESNFWFLLALGALRANMRLIAAESKILEAIGYQPDGYIVTPNADAPNSAPVFQAQMSWMQDRDPSIQLPAIGNDPAAIAVIGASSGSTGRKKLIPLPLSAFEFMVVGRDIPEFSPRAQINYFEYMSTLGFSLDLAALYQGRRIIRPATRGSSIQQLFLSQGVEAVFAPPSTLSQLVHYGRERKMSAVNHIKYVFTCGGGMSRTLIEQVTTIIAPELFLAYGATEFGRTAMSNSRDLRDIPGIVGQIDPWAKIDAVDENGVALPPDTQGRIRINVDPTHRAFGFIQSGSTLVPFADDHIYPGDLGYVTNEGHLVITGRDGATANQGGMTFALDLIESHAAEHQSVDDVAAISLANEAGYDDVYLLVVAAGSGTVDPVELTGFVLDRLGCRVSGVRQVESLNRDPTGNFDRNALAIQIRQRH